ncbi:MAG TPA: T9SS type A sorting domain-containing protein, partial [Bacteroidia bacterium]|nr:T9SS type A sorting domain-containing protein [Bacteroidia bacterium]
LIIWAHGGSFLSGSSTDADVDTLCHRFAKKGYACASINYRLGVTSFDSSGFIPALVRSVQDMKAAVRFFYKDKLTSNTYKIDTNNIFIGGSSAGSFTALHYAYLKRSCQVTTYISQQELDSLGGLSGYSGNQCYSEHVNGVIDLCGALGTYGWLEAGDLPLCSMHGNNDNTVNYSRGEVLPSYGIHILFADGSRMLKAQALTAGVSDNFYTWYGADHVPYAGTSATQIKYMDTTVNFVHDYLLQRLGYSCTASQLANTPYGTPTLYPFTNCSTNSPLNCAFAGIKSVKANLLQEVYPNPAENQMNIVFANSNDMHTLQLTDLSGRVVKSVVTTQAVYTLEKANLNAGVYFLKVSNNSGETSVQKIIFN